MRILAFEINAARVNGFSTGMCHDAASAVENAMQPLDAVGAAIEPIDLDHLIRQTMGDPSLEREVIDLFVDEMDRARRQLVSGMQLGRAALAHRIRGAAASIGAKALAASAASLEADPDRIDLAAALLVRMHEATAYIAERRRTNG